MKLNILYSGIFINTGVWLTLILMLSPASATEDLRTLHGPPFSDPSYVQQMPADWVQQPIIYDDDLKKADLVISLNQQFFSFMEPLIRQYARKHNLNIIANQGTCGISAGMLARKKGDIGGFCCPPAETDRLPGIRFNTIGIHPVSILVHPDNPIANITLEQVRQVFQGEISRWSELGWRGTPIYLTGRLHCKNRPGHWRLLLDNEDLFAPQLRTVGNIEDMFSLVSSNPDAIGYEVMWMSLHYEDTVKTLKIDGRSPQELQHLLEGRYPFYRVLYLTTWEGEHVKNPHSQALVDYLTKEIEESGDKIGIIPAGKLRKAGWKFKDNELIGEPE